MPEITHQLLLQRVCFLSVAQLLGTSSIEHAGEASVGEASCRDSALHDVLTSLVRSPSACSQQPPQQVALTADMVSTLMGGPAAAARLEALWSGAASENDSLENWLGYLTDDHIAARAAGTLFFASKDLRTKRPSAAKADGKENLGLQKQKQQQLQQGGVEGAHRQPPRYMGLDRLKGPAGRARLAILQQGAEEQARQHQAATTCHKQAPGARGSSLPSKDTQRKVAKPQPDPTLDAYSVVTGLEG